jgi:hypothetical protein
MYFITVRQDWSSLCYVCFCVLINWLWIYKNTTENCEINMEIGIERQ